MLRSTSMPRGARATRAPKHAHGDLHGQEHREDEQEQRREPQHESVHREHHEAHTEQQFRGGNDDRHGARELLCPDCRTPRFRVGDLVRAGEGDDRTHHGGKNPREHGHFTATARVTLPL
ncbi:MAG: hypothetical protein EBS32_07845 [Actinobacteria bacterium]|nr:hypothetical protein [Actinomycetota bacterium]